MYMGDFYWLVDELDPDTLNPIGDGIRYETLQDIKNVPPYADVFLVWVRGEVPYYAEFYRDGRRLMLSTKMYKEGADENDGTHCMTPRMYIDQARHMQSYDWRQIYNSVDERDTIAA